MSSCFLSGLICTRLTVCIFWQELTRTLEQQRREVQVTPGDSVRLREVQMEIQLAEEHIAELEDKLSAANAQGFAPGNFWRQSGLIRTSSVLIPSRSLSMPAS